MIRLQRLLERWAAPVLVRTACVLSLSALGLTALGILWPRPLLVMAAASLGQGLIVLALACYGLAVFADSMRGERGHTKAQTSTDDEEIHG